MTGEKTPRDHLSALLLTQLARGTAKLTDSPFKRRFDLSTNYLMSLTAENLLRNHYLEAGLWSYSGSASTTLDPESTGDQPSDWHWGWESPTCQLRGHFLGHWLSAAAGVFAQTEDEQVRARTAHIVRELARCQRANGGRWLAAFPEAYLHRIANGQAVWAPQYTIHKLFMGLFDVFELMGLEEALSISMRFAEWFDVWTASFDRKKMDDVLDYETGGMLEAWSNLYGATGDDRMRGLIYRYDRPRLFDPLLRGEDVLTNKHANTQIPEILGAARAWEVTGEQRWRDVTLAFWKAAVDDRGTYCTGGVSCGEVWTPPGRLSARLGSAQEHCVVYNMMRLSQILYRWTGQARYADFWERNLENGILAQQNRKTGMVSYFLEMGPGSRKVWGSRTNHFWCCHGTLVQAQAAYDHAIYFESSDGLIVSQFIPSELTWRNGSTNVRVSLFQDSVNGATAMQSFSTEGLENIQRVDLAPPPHDRPKSMVYHLVVSCDAPTEFCLSIRIPSWVSGSPIIRVNGDLQDRPEGTEGFLRLARRWHDERIDLEFPKTLSTVPLPDRPDTVAFLDGPVVLAGIVDEERSLEGDPARPDTMLAPDNERHHSYWRFGTYKTVNQPANFRFVPLHEVTDETYTVYFPIRREQTHGAQTKEAGR